MSTENQLTHRSTSDTNSTASELIPARQWSSTQDGPQDPIVDIWYNGKWVPAYFKDIRAGDFFLYLDSQLNPDQCFFAKTPARSIGVWQGQKCWAVDGLEIKQAPAIRDVNTRSTLPSITHQPKD